jgi:hypothetical protein
MGILIGELNVIARIVTIFFIITYGFLNITYTLESWAGTDFRPSFRIPWIISVIGAITCIVVMIQLDIVALIGASVLLFGLFLFLKKKELTLQTGDTWNSIWASLVKTGLRKLSTGNQQLRNWRPNIIVFSGGVKNRPHLIEMAKSLVGKLGIFTNFELMENKDERTVFSKNQQVTEEQSPSGKGVYTRKYVCRDIYEGIESISRIYGFTGFEPNTILMGWPTNSRNPEAFINLVKRLRKMDYNQVFLSYNKTHDFGKYKQIDFWWSGQGRNISFAISMIRFLLSTHKWRAAKVRILMVNNQSGMGEKYYELLEQILENTRLKAEIKLINNSVEKLKLTEIMRTESVNTDLSVIELDDKQEGAFEQISNLLLNLPSSLIIKASSFFDEHSLVERTDDEKLVAFQETGNPSFDIASKLKLANKEIIANEVFNIAQKLETITTEYYNDAFGDLKSHSVLQQEEILSLVEKTLDQFDKAAKAEDLRLLRTEFLRIVNDFSFRAQTTLKDFKNVTAPHQKQALQKSTEKYLKKTDIFIQGLPQYIRIKYHWKEYSLLKADSTLTAFFKIFSLAKSRITGQQATYKIKVSRAARYFLYHKRLLLINKLIIDYALFNFESIITIRKILSGIYELAEKGKNNSLEKGKLKDIISMERDRFRATLSLQYDTTSNFYNNIGLTLESELYNDLQNLNNILARPAANFLSKPFSKAVQKDSAFYDELMVLPDIWLKNIQLYANKVYLDFFLQSLKNRIESKIRKYNYEYLTHLTSNLIIPLRDFQNQLREFTEKDSFDKPLQKDMFQIPSPEQHFNKLYEEITAMFADLPLEMSIAGDDLARALEQTNIREATEIVLNVRKTVEFSISSDLIDFVKKQTAETSNVLSKSLNRIKDSVKIINFNLNADDDQQTIEEKRLLALDFIEKLKIEEAFVLSTANTYESAFITGLKNTFAPLSSSIIAKTSGGIQKKLAQSKNQKLWNQVSTWQKTFTANLQEQIVSLVYSKSESILWMGKMEKPFSQAELANEEVYSWLDVYAPNPEIINKLPFYYAKLFSGQSGIGDDFWIGMQEEIKLAEAAIHRFKRGQPGCLIISGARNSGKTSLSKHVARKHFSSTEIYNIRAPRECTADVSLFENTILKTLHSNYSSLEQALGELQKPVVFIINDLELWWERRNNGTEVIDRLLLLIREHHQKALFIINVNSTSLAVIHKITGIQSWSLGLVSCNGFDARELHDLILLRHQAGGMTFVMEKIPENNMSAWSKARLFNRYFDISEGNPGRALNLWIASVHKVEGKTIHIRKPASQNADFLDKLSHEQILLLIQFVYHIRLSVDQLSRNLQIEKERVENQILNLWQTGILVVKFPGIYAINAALQQPLVSKLIAMKLLQ